VIDFEARLWINSFSNNVKTINDVLHKTFKDTCIALNLYEDDNQYMVHMTEATGITPGQGMDKIFCNTLLNCKPTNPDDIFDTFWEDMICKDFLYPGYLLCFRGEHNNFRSRSQNGKSEHKLSELGHNSTYNASRYFPNRTVPKYCPKVFQAN